jgi:predicted transcriptional regulator
MRVRPAKNDRMREMALGELESEVLQTLTQLGEAPAREVRQQLEGNGNRVAYTTVATILGRLFRKGLIHRRREKCRGGTRYVYRPTDFERRYLAQLLKGVVDLFGPSGVVHLNEEIEKMQPSEEREIRRRLKL